MDGCKRRLDQNKTVEMVSWSSRISFGKFKGLKYSDARAILAGRDGSTKGRELHNYLLSCCKLYTKSTSNWGANHEITILISWLHSKGEARSLNAIRRWSSSPSSSPRSYKSARSASPKGCDDDSDEEKLIAAFKAGLRFSKKKN